MTNETNLYDISAEFLLNYLYPDRMDQWEVDCAGTFYRNYSEDILAIDEEKGAVRLARDSFLRLLPQGVIANDNALKGNDFEQKYERLKKKEELLRSLFKPVDTLAFRFRLHIENQVTQLSEKKLVFLLKHYFHYDITREKDPYILKVAPFLLFAFCQPVAGKLRFYSRPARLPVQPQGRNTQGPLYLGRGRALRLSGYRIPADRSQPDGRGL